MSFWKYFHQLLGDGYIFLKDKKQSMHAVLKKKKLTEKTWISFSSGSIVALCVNPADGTRKRCTKNVSI